MGGRGTGNKEIHTECRLHALREELDVFTGVESVSSLLVISQDYRANEKQSYSFSPALVAAGPYADCCTHYGKETTSVAWLQTAHWYLYQGKSAGNAGKWQRPVCSCGRPRERLGLGVP